MSSHVGPRGDPFAAGLGVLGVAVLAPAILRRVFEGGEDLRFAYAAAGIRMFLESPIIRTGPGTWVVQRAAVHACT